MTRGQVVDKVVSRKVLVPFILVTLLFALWGFANDITNPMVSAFSRILQMSTFQGLLVQFAFYGGYLCNGISGGVVHKEVFVQGRNFSGFGALCSRCPFIYTRKHDDGVLALLSGILHSDLRLVVFGD